MRESPTVERLIDHVETGYESLPDSERRGFGDRVTAALLAGYGTVLFPPPAKAPTDELLRFNPQTFTVKVGDHELALTENEYKLLHRLYQESLRTENGESPSVKMTQLKNYIWPDESAPTARCGS